MNKKDWLSVFVMIAVIIFAWIILKNPSSQVPEKTAKCIGENSLLYTQKGCSHCERQEELFGENVKYLNITDCFYTPEKCSGIEVTPTWIINNEKYTGFQDIEKLKELTGC